MHTSSHVVQRYRRTDQHRIGEWVPVDSSWKTAASAGLVAHDIYHHLPADKGTFAHELAALGAEWYIDVQPLKGGFDTLFPSVLESFQRNVSDTVLNALDSREARPFALASKSAPPAAPEELAYFERLAQLTWETLASSQDPRARDSEDFTQRFVENLLWGVAQARERFPDQRAVRVASDTLVEDLVALSPAEVPVGHEITITLTGYDCRIEFADADAPFRAENLASEAVLMLWYSYEDGYPLKEASLHVSTAAYLDHVERHFAVQDALALDDADKRMPEGETDTLHKVYVTSPTLKTALAADQSMKLSLTVLQAASQSPRGVMVL